jgi:hypothetical protein
MIIEDDDDEQGGAIDSFRSAHLGGCRCVREVSVAMRRRRARERESGCSDKDITCLNGEWKEFIKFSSVHSRLFNRCVFW